MEYPGAHHGFDNRQLPPAARRPAVLNPGHCQWIEESPGRVIDRETGRPALQDVGTFLGTTFQMAPAG